MQEEPTITLTLTKIQARCLTRYLSGLQREGDSAVLDDVCEILTVKLLERGKRYR